MDGSLQTIRSNRRIMAYTACAMYGAAVVDGAIEGLLPGEPSFSIVPIIGVIVTFAFLAVFGSRLPRQALALFGPLGVALIAYAIATTPGAGDGAVLYALPVVWTSLFFGRRGALAILLCVGVAHAIALLVLPGSSSYPGRWLDVMVSAGAIALVVLALEERIDTLVGRLASEARTDALTGLLNRRGFDERARLELAHTERLGGPVALASFDLDYFKRINDEYGHEIGDRVLARVGRRLAGEARAIDVVARHGGEEFAVLLPGTDAAGAKEFTDRVRRALTADDSPDLPRVRASAGVTATHESVDLHTLMEQADEALYTAKRSGRDRTAVFDAGNNVLLHAT